MCDEGKADGKTVMNLYETSCPALARSQVARSHATNRRAAISLLYRSAAQEGIPDAQIFLFVRCNVLLFAKPEIFVFIRYARRQNVLGGFPEERLLKALLSGFPRSSSSSDG